jgi:cell division protease FtsH
MTTITQSAYSEFISQLKLGQIKNVKVEANLIEYTLKAEFGGNVYQTAPVGKDIDLPQLLAASGVEYTIVNNDNNLAGNLFSILISAGMLFGTWLWLAKYSEAGGGTLGGVGKSKARVYNEGKTGIKFADVAGVDEAKQELEEIVDFLKNGDKYRKIGAKIPKGVLLVGPPGTGKTLLAKAVAGEAGVPFLNMSGSEFVELFVGVGASRVRDLFKQAKRQSPAIIFIDELDAIGKSRSSNPSLGGNDEREQTLNQLLTEMDGFDGDSGIIIIGATNRPEILDPALRRPGRFDRQVLVDRPDKIGREAILNVHARNVNLDRDVNLTEIAIQTAGFAGADLANLVNEAALMAARRDRETVANADFKEAIERVVAGLEKRSRVLNDRERKTVAYHEVGHALVGALMPGGGKVSKISIVPRGMGALGYTLQTPEEDRFLMQEDELRGRIATLLGGRAAEEIIFGKVSTGASDDIQKATDLAERAVTLYGMSDRLGPVAFEKSQQQFLDGGNYRRTVGEGVTAEIDKSIKETIGKARELALAILELNRDLLESTTQTLLTSEVLEGDKLQAILDRVLTPENLDGWLSA